MRKLEIDWNKVLEDYKTGLSTIKLAKKYNCGVATVKVNLEKLGCVFRNNREYRTKYHFDHNYFETIDNEHKAYWFGFISADGNIRIHGNQYVVQFASCDKEVIEGFIRDIHGDMPVITENRGDRLSPCYRVHLTSEKMYKDLEGHGCTPRKSLTLKFPSVDDVPKHLMQHYIRGFFDGDGSVFILNKKWVKTPISNPTIEITHKLGVNINGTKEYLEELCKYMYISKVKKVGNRPLTNTYYCSTDTNATVKNVYNYMYKNATIYLPRKKQKFDDYYSKKDVQRL